MSKIGLILKREYITRVRKRSFIVMTFLGPFLFAAFIVLPTWLAKVEDNEVKTIAVVETDELNNPLPDSMRFFDVLPNNNFIHFQYVSAPVKTLKETLPQTEYYAILHIPYNVINTEIIEFYSLKHPSMGIENYITGKLNDYIYKIKLRKKEIPVDVLNSVHSDIKFKTIKLEGDGEFHEQGGKELQRTIGYISGFLIIFLFSFLVHRLCVV
ncbi:MAG: ABC transporter permease [Bacteroidales bacterium]|nr:ABC transporter permease [Bacteroidales bacterium]